MHMNKTCEVSTTFHYRSECRMPRFNDTVMSMIDATTLKISGGGFDTLARGKLPELNGEAAELSSE